MSDNWTSFAALSAVPQAVYDDLKLRAQLAEQLAADGEDMARRTSNAPILEVGEASFEWHEVTRENRAALEAQLGDQPLEVGDRVAKVTIPCLRGPWEPDVPEEVAVLLEAVGLTEEALRQARRVRVWPMNPDRIAVYLAVRALENALGDLKVSAEVLAEAAAEHRKVRP